MSAHSLIGHQLDEYSVIQLLGHGGMARVYLAEDVRLKRRVALKVIEGISDPDTKRRFEQEAQAIARLEHPHIVRLYRYGEVGGLFYMAMQYVEGSTLQALLEKHHRASTYLDAGTVTRLLRDVCDALDYAHSQGVIHRDVKPSNILLDQTGRLYLADFGLARQMNVDTRGEVFGSVHYIAPEQAISSARTVPQSDLYAVGVILYEMLTGKVPFDGTDPSEIALRHIDEKPRSPHELRPELPPGVELVVLKALAKKPSGRYPNGRAFADAVASALHQRKSRPSAAPVTPHPRHVSAPPQRVTAPQKRRSRGRRFFVYAISILLLLLILTPAGYYWLDMNKTSDPKLDSPIPTALHGDEVMGLVVIATRDHHAYLRSGPGTGYETINSVPDGSWVTVVGRNAAGDWLRVRTAANDPNTEAWIAAILVQLPENFRIEELSVID
ncbi:MAG TPA: serine/threonine protein kinase [Aggregatilineaceae bacterium]|nr:serine/threonine protein kinase [Aggregatilineaceae bacterium]